jgi:type VI secretion system secreted protein Hcp
MAVVDFFLKLDGILGESKDAKHKGEIDLESFSWAESNAGTPAGGAGGGGGAGKVHMDDLHVQMKMSKASPLLLLACASGQHIKQAVLTARKAGKEQLEFLVVKMTDVLVSSYETAAGTDALPTDTVSFNFARIDVELRPQRPDGTPDAPVKVGWDVKANRKV